MTPITADTVYTDKPANPIESEQFLADYVDDLVDAVLETIPTEVIIAEARSHHPNDVAAQRARAMSLVHSWFETHVDAEEFDSDVYSATRQHIFDTFTTAVSTPVGPSSKTTTQSVY